MIAARSRCRSTLGNTLLHLPSGSTAVACYVGCLTTPGSLDEVLIEQVNSVPKYQYIQRNSQGENLT
jgi:LSD1 subclass zinc finger protein